MIQQLRNILLSIQDGISAGLVLGAGLIFLTLIGIPSDDSEQLASISVELYLLITVYLGWRIARLNQDRPLAAIVGNVVATGVTAAVALLAFLSLINGWHADGIDVAGLYFANMNTFPIHTLSGVPLEELGPNPALNPLTGEYPADAVLRTSPFLLSTSADISILDIASIHIGGLYGLGLLLTLSAILGGTIQRVYLGIDWQHVNATFRNRESIGGQLTHTVATIFHWFVLILPFLLFLIFWATVEHQRGTESGLLAIPILDTSSGLYDALADSGATDTDSFQVINLTETFELTSESLVDARSIQLGLTFMIIITAMVALRRAEIKPVSVSYPLRIIILVTPLLVMMLLSLWRIETSQVVIFAPSINIFELDGLALTRISLALLTIGMLIYAIVGSRNSAQFEITLATVIGASAFLVSPLFMNQDQTSTLGLVMLFVMFGLGLNIVVGFAGLLDLGYVAFYAIGAYTFAFISVTSDQFKLNVDQVNMLGWSIVAGLILTPLLIFSGLSTLQRRDGSSLSSHRVDGWKKKASVWDNRPAILIVLFLMIAAIGITLVVGSFLTGADLGTFSTNTTDRSFSPFLITIVVALLVGAMGGLILGFPVLRLRGDYLAIVTLGFGEIISLALTNLDSTTGGPQGALGIPKPVEASIAVSNLVLLYLSIIGAFLVILVSINLRNSRIGRAWLAMRSDEDIAQAMGINLVNVKLLAFSIGASMAALAGMIFASRQSSIFPENFNLDISIRVLSLVIIGGMGSIPGVVVGSIVLIGLPELLRPIESYRVMAFGFLLIITMVVRPEGLLPAPAPELESRARELAEKERQQHAEE